ATIIGLITGVLGFLASVIGVATGCCKCFIEDPLQMFRAKGCLQPEIDIIGSVVKQVKRNIWQHVSREGAGTICIHGIAGVGKTAIVATINNLALRKPKLFDFFFLVSVSDGANLWQVQEDIASVISEKLPVDSNIGNRVGKLRTALTGKKKFLLILDSMWQGYSPSDIGIPELTGGRKLIVTSRLHSVLDSMGGNEHFVIKPLTNDDDWTLFEHELGSDNLSKLSSEILTRTKNAIQDLQGVPLAIKKLAQNLKNKCQNSQTNIVAEWEEVLDCLSRSATFLEDRNHELFSSLQKSYQHLRAETQRCFLFCALYPKAHPIETKELIDYWMWESMLGFGTLRKMRSNGNKRLDELRDANLLENVNEVEKKAVKMPNLIRDMALAIADEKFLVEAGNSHTQFALAGAWPEGVVRVSFMRNQLGVLFLPDSYHFDMLSTLLLLDNPFNQNNHHNLFFSWMRNLKLLDLLNTRLSFLPNSLSDLTDLRALLLRNCQQLSDLPSLSKLSQLYALELPGTRLEKWPEKMHLLTNLRRLDLTQAKSDTFPAECIRSYNKLEELLMMWDTNSRGCMWGSNEVTYWNGACVEWLPNLGHLAVLELVFLNARVFNSYMNACSKTTDGYAITTTCFKFFVGGVHSASVESNSHKNSITVIDDHRIVLPQSTLVLNLMSCPEELRSLNMTGCLQDLTVLDVFDFNGLTYLLTFDMWHSLGNLRKVCVRRCRNIEGIIQPGEQANPIIISHSSLVELVLLDLQRLRSVGGRQTLHFKNLAKIKVWECPLLRLPQLPRVRDDNVIEIEGEKEWWDCVREQNPDIDGCRVGFREAPVPLELSSYPRYVYNNFGAHSYNGFPTSVLTLTRSLSFLGHYTTTFQKLRLNANPDNT
ncbi:hypothetical protein Ancab_004731, partial [Ancistrocladus abbreviatus]